MDFINKLKNALEAYAYSTDVPISIINNLGNEVLQLGTTCSFCEFFKECTDEQCPCSQTHLYAGKQAERIGEAYIFSCPTGLIHYTVPLLKKGQLKGSVLAGPLLLDFVDDLIVDDIIQKFNLGVNMRGMVASKLRMIPVIEPLKVRHLSNLLFFVVTGLLEDEKHILLERNKKLFQQSQISESIQEVKNTSNTAFYSYDSEKELLAKVKSGDVIGAKTITNDLLGQIFFSSGGNMEMIKLRTLELCTLLSRATVEGGADFNKIFDLNSNFLSELSKIENLEELSYWLIKTLDKFTAYVFKFDETKNNALIQRCVAFIHNHYKENLTLDMVANMVHLNASYFSSLFKREVGVNFSNYLNKVRIEKSMQLLKNTALSILEVALEVGYEDQSYFGKVFKSVINMTPKEYKQKLL